MATELEKIMTSFDRTFMPVVKQTFGDNLLSVILYGSAVKGRFVDRTSDVNVLIILKSTDPEALVDMGKRARSVMRKNRINPLLLTEGEFLGSADVFPMEYLDIRDSRKVVYGSDLTERLDLTHANLRHQVEEELRGSIAGVRRVLMGSGGKAALVGRFIKEWAGSRNALFRGLLRLGGVEGTPPENTIRVLGQTFSVDTAPLEQAARFTAGERIPPIETAAGLLRCLTELASAVDSMEV